MSLMGQTVDELSMHKSPFQSHVASTYPAPEADVRRIRLALTGAPSRSRARLASAPSLDTLREFSATADHAVAVPSGKRCTGRLGTPQPTVAIRCLPSSTSILLRRPEAVRLMAPRGAQA